ncbi:MAG: hypothetical protein ACTHJ8_10590 [Mucilaginibacter sp.]
MAKQLESEDFKRGGLEFAKIISIQLNSKTLTPESLEYEIQHWNSREYEAVKTQQQIDTAALASNSAQVRQFTKDVNSVKPAIEEMNRALESIGLKAIPL